MNVDIKIDNNLKEPYITIHAPCLTEEIQQMITLIQSTSTVPIISKEDDIYHILSPSEIYMIRSEEQHLIIYTQSKQFNSNKRLYELEKALGNSFIRISKSSLVNLKYLDSVEPSFSGTMCLKLKNGLKDYISRKYLPDFKKYLGL